MKDKQINLKLPDELWIAAKVKAAQNRIKPVTSDALAARGVGRFRPWSPSRLQGQRSRRVARSRLALESPI